MPLQVIDNNGFPQIKATVVFDPFNPFHLEAAAQYFGNTKPEVAVYFEVFADYVAGRPNNLHNLEAPEYEYWVEDVAEQGVADFCEDGNIAFDVYLDLDPRFSLRTLDLLELFKIIGDVKAVGALEKAIADWAFDESFTSVVDPRYARVTSVFG